jgi:hypothetical protein
LQGIQGISGESYWVKNPSGIHTFSNVGIGTINPSASFEVSGDVIIEGTTSGNLVRITQLGSGSALIVEHGTRNDANAFVVLNSGQVGIGVLTPAEEYILEVDGGNIRFVDGGQGDVVISHANLVSNIRAEGSVQLGLGANGQNDDIRIDLNHNVGIGSTLPKTKLDVIGNARISGILTVGSSSITLNGTTNILNVGTGVTIYGNTGVVSATTYYGDGSKLTGISPSLTVSTRAGYAGINSTDAITNVSAIRFDKNTGFAVTDLGNGEVFVELGSTFKTWTVDGQTSLEAVGEDAVEFVAGPGIAITTKATAPKAITFSVDENDLTLGSATDGSLTTPGALNTFTNQTKIVDSIDDLNELAFNIIKNTAVTNVDFSSSPVAGGSPLNVNLSITYSGNPNRYDVDWGDGSTSLNLTSASASHTYSQSSGGINTVTVTARNTTGSGAGSSFTTTKSNYITVYTPDPSVDFKLYSISSGGSEITYWDSAVPFYLENITSNVTGFAVTYSINFGGGVVYYIPSNSAPGGVGGGRTTHTYTNASETDTIYTVTTTLSSHPGANPTGIPTSKTQTYKVYSTHTPSFTSGPIVGINSQSNSGFPVQFTNTTENTIGSFTSFGITYRWTWGDATTDNVNVGSNASGDTGRSISHTFALTTNEQAVGTSKTFATNLRVISNHSSSPFISTDIVITVEPEVRSIFTGVATVASDRTGDTVRTLYNGIDLFGRDRKVGIFTNTSQNASDYVYAWGDGSSNDTVPNNVSAGGTLTSIYHTFQGATGTKTVTLTANGTPGTLVQNGKTSTVAMTLNAVPAAPTSITASSLSLSSTSQGTSPRLCANSTRNATGVGIVTGTSITRYVTTTPILTNTLTNINGSASGTVSALLNGVGIGTTTFTTATGETGTFANLVISSEGDARDRISASTYPTGFYQVFSAYITKPLSEISTGLNDFGISHSTLGSCGFTTFVKDNINVTPTLTSGTLSEGTAGTKRYISGIAYYNTGSPTITLGSVEVSNLTGQTYQDTSTPVNLAVDQNYESTSANVISATQNYTYSQISPAGDPIIDAIYSVPKANIGVGYGHTLNSLSIPITTSSVRTIQSLRIRASNSAGTGSYTSNNTKVQVHTAAQSGISEISITVPSGLGDGTYTDNGVRIFNFSAATTNTPSYNGATNFYTNNPYTESSDPGVAGTKEATIRLGVLKYDVTNYSSGYLPVGPDRSGDTGTQYFTFAFRRKVVSNFDINITSSSGISGLWIAAPGTNIDSTSGLNGWLRADTAYAGSGVPGSGTGGNGSDGCAYNNGDRILSSTSLSGGYTMTLGSENLSNATGNVLLVRIALTSGQSITSLSIGAAVL